MVSAVLMLLTPILSLYLPWEVAYYAVAVLMVLLGANTSVLMASVMGLASTLPPRYIGAVVTGFCISGCLTGLMKLLMLAIFPGGHHAAAWIFFGTASLMSVLCIVAVLYLEHNKFAQFHFSASPSPASPKGVPLTKRMSLVVSRKLEIEQNSLVSSPRGYSIKAVFRRTRRDIDKANEMEIKEERRAKELQAIKSNRSMSSAEEEAMTLNFEDDHDEKTTQLAEPLV
jgi:hypothetical protein